jgi:hypothetical protein
MRPSEDTPLFFPHKGDTTGSGRVKCPAFLFDRACPRGYAKSTSVRYVSNVASCALSFRASEKESGNLAVRKAER